MFEKKGNTMFLKNLFQPKYLALLLILIILGSAAYGLAAANVVPETGAGEGSGTVSGYTISNVTYALLTTDPTKVESVSIDVAPTTTAGVPATVRISVDSGVTWISCTGPTTNTWLCAFGTGSEPAISTIASLEVIAMD